MPRALTTEEAAKALGYTPQWVCQLVRLGKLSALRGKQRRYTFDPKEIASFKKNHPSDVNPLPATGKKEN